MTKIAPRRCRPPLEFSVVSVFAGSLGAGELPGVRAQRKLKRPRRAGVPAARVRSAAAPAPKPAERRQSTESTQHQWQGREQGNYGGIIRVFEFDRA